MIPKDARVSKCDQVEVLTQHFYLQTPAAVVRLHGNCQNESEARVSQRDFTADESVLIIAHSCSHL